MDLTQAEMKKYEFQIRDLNKSTHAEHTLFDSDISV